MGVWIGRSPLPETVLNAYSAFQEEVWISFWGVGWREGASPGLGQVTTQIKASLRFHRCGWLLGVSDVWWDSHLHLEQKRWKSLGSDNEVNLLYRCRYFSGQLISNPEEDKHRACTSEFPLSWLTEVLTVPGAGGRAGSTPEHAVPFLKIKITAAPSPSLTPWYPEQP